MIDPASLPNANLRGYTAIVIGPRAYETQPALVANNRRLLDYARGAAPSSCSTASTRCSSPASCRTRSRSTAARPRDGREAPVTVLDTAAAILRAPNRITAKDFDGWIQDRSLYMPRTLRRNTLRSSR
jgi:hypothetical protein